MKVKGNKIVNSPAIFEAMRNLVVFHLSHPHVTRNQLEGELYTILRRVNIYTYHCQNIRVYLNSENRISRVCLNSYTFDEDSFSYSKDTLSSVELFKFSELYTGRLVVQSIIDQIYGYSFTSRRQKVARNQRKA